MRFGAIALVLGIGFLGGSPLAGQNVWDSPLLIGPGSPGGFSLFLVDPGEGLGAMGRWHGTGASSRVGFRAGVAETHADELYVFGGVDFVGPLYRSSEEFPLDIIWVTGLGLGVRDDAVISIPIGVSIGRVVTEEGVWFHPYLAPRLIMDAYLGDDDLHSHEEGEAHRHGHDDLELGFALDLGADFSFSGSWAIRIGASVGDREGLAIGFSIPTG